MWIKKKSLYDKLNKDWIQSQVALRTLEWKVSQMFIHVYTHLSFKTLNRKFFLCIASSSIQIDAQHTWHCQKTSLCFPFNTHFHSSQCLLQKRTKKNKSHIAFDESAMRCGWRALIQKTRPVIVHLAFFWFCLYESRKYYETLQIFQLSRTQYRYLLFDHFISFSLWINNMHTSYIPS